MSLSATANLTRGIRRWDLVALAINFTIGGGIFGLPSKVFALSGPASILAYILCAGAVIPIVLCFAEVASRFTQTGGPYLYARAAFGPLVAFEVGWLRWLAGVASSAALVNLLVDYLGYMVPAVRTGPWPAATITVVICGLTTVNVLGVRDVAIASNFFALAKLLPLLLLIAIGLFFIHPQNFATSPTPANFSLSPSVLLLVYAFTGFESVSIPAGEVQHPQRNIPFALLVAIGATTLIYVLIQVVCVGTLPGLANSATPLADAGRSFLGAGGAWLIAAGGAVSIAGTIHGHILTSPRLLFAMAEQGQLPRLLSTIHSRYHTPYFSIVLTAVLILGCALSGTFVQLAAISVLARLTIYIVTCAALPVLRRKPQMAPPTFKLLGGSSVPAIAIVLCLWLLVHCKPREGFMTGAAAAIGLLIFGTYRMTVRAMTRRAMNARQ